MLSYCLVMMKGYQKDVGSSAFTLEKPSMNAKFLQITHPKAAIIMAMTEHERQDLSQSPLQCSLVTEAVRAVPGTITR